MKLLALETATEYCSTALWLDGQVIQRSELAGQRHSSMLLPQCRELLAEAGLAFSAIDAVAFGQGPGSFTGVRIACSVAQGLAFGHGLPVVAVSSLRALGQAGERRLLTCQDARMGEVYVAAWQQEATGWLTIVAPTVCAAAEIPLPEGDGWIACGSGFAVYGESLQARLGGKTVLVDGTRYPQAARLAELAVEEFMAGSHIDPADAVPLYVRNRVALKISER